MSNLTNKPHTRNKRLMHREAPRGKKRVSKLVLSWQFEDVVVQTYRPVKSYPVNTRQKSAYRLFGHMSCRVFVDWLASYKSAAARGTMWNRSSLMLSGAPRNFYYLPWSWSQNDLTVTRIFFRLVLQFTWVSVATSTVITVMFMLFTHYLTYLCQI